MENKLLEEILQDEQLKALCDTLTKDEIDDNLLTLYKQKKDNDYLKANKGIMLDNDKTYMESYLEKRGHILYQMYRPSKKQDLDLDTLYMPFTKSTGDVYLEDRARLFKLMKDSKTNNKGIYLYGSYGVGKTYLMMKHAKDFAITKHVLFVYYPELINDIKSMIAKGLSIDEKIDKMKHCDVLFIDDIGREQNTIFNRDQILGVVINYRYQNDLQTFMTSNRSLNELSDHLAETNDKIDVVSAGAIIDRIRNMMVVCHLEGKDYRKS